MTMNRKKNILYIDDDHAQFGIFSENMQSLGEKKPICAPSLDDDNVETLINDGIDIAFIDYYLDDDIKGTAIAKKLKEKHELRGHKIPIHFILLTGQGSEMVAKDVIRSGLFQDYINKGVGIEKEIERALLHFETIRKKDEEVIKAKKQAEAEKQKRFEAEKRAEKSEKELKNIQKLFKVDLSQYGDKESLLKGNSDVMRGIRWYIDVYSKTNLPLLLLGDTGTGKELVAKEIHKQGERKDKPFIAINCAAIPENLIESELFGHKKGAFTDATNDKDGAFKRVGKGTLFLDEFADMSSLAQVKVLRAISEKQFLPLGAPSKKDKDEKKDGYETFDGRIICATSQDFSKLLDKGGFRVDLLHRVNSLFPKLPSLSEHREDIYDIVFLYLQEKYKYNPLPLEPEAISTLRDSNYNWPGNVRELLSFVDNILVLFPGGERINAENIIKLLEVWKTHQLDIGILEEMGKSNSSDKDVTLNIDQHYDSIKNKASQERTSKVTNKLKLINAAISLDGVGHYATTLNMIRDNCERINNNDSLRDECYMERLEEIGDVNKFIGDWIRNNKELIAAIVYTTTDKSKFNNLEMVSTYKTEVVPILNS